MTSSGDWLLCVDTGGTFTDCVARAPDGRSHRCKVLSNATLRATITEVLPDHKLRIKCSWNAPQHFLVGARLRDFRVTAYEATSRTIELDNEAALNFSVGESVEFSYFESAPLLAAHLVTGTPLLSPLPAMRLRLATTRGTNALLERKIGKVGWITNGGFTDVLDIGTQQRPDIFARQIVKPAQVHASSFGLNFRQDATGAALSRLDLNELESVMRAWKNEGIGSIAVSFLHSDLNPEPEKQVAEFFQHHGFKSVSASAELSAKAGFLNRSATAVTNAALAPILDAYFSEIETSVPRDHLEVMSSAGALMERSQFHAKDSLLSGPAGGVVGAAAIGQQCGEGPVITFDMGGTSTDVARIDGKFSYQFEHRVGDVKLMAPALRIETVAAGGGSICDFDGEKMRVGPHSAGAHPGPACYGAGGPLTITDINLLAKRMNASQFSLPVDRAAAEAALQKVLTEIRKSTGEMLSRDQLLEGFLQLADEIMAGAIRKISTLQGYDPASHTLIAFGGAGGQHACGIAARLGIQRVLCPADAGLLSAYGLSVSTKGNIVETQLALSLEPTNLAQIQAALETIQQKALAPLPVGSAVTQQLFSLRFQGQEFTLSVECRQPEDLEKTFLNEYRQCFGYLPPGAPGIELTGIKVIASSTSTERPAEFFIKKRQRQNNAFYPRDTLSAGDDLRGPAVVQDGFGSVFIAAGWSGVVGDRGTLRLEAGASHSADSTVSLIREQILAHQLADLVEDAGNQLQRTAISTNVKDRLDFSCALLDSSGYLIINAPHIPVHLGAMGICVREILKQFDLRDGDVIVTNHPGAGGSHLPDVTVVTPVFLGEVHPVCYVANRAHHAEIGGTHPGSMPPGAHCLEEEGVVISPMFLFREGSDCFAEMEKVLSEAKYPSRAVVENLADLRAQVAANRQAIRRLEALAVSPASLSGHFDSLKERTRKALAQRLPELQPAAAMQRLDDGTEIHVAIRKSAERICFDFTGTSPSHPGNFNATPAIVQSAILYCLRLLIHDDIRLNEGLMENVDVVLPECFLNPDFRPDPSGAPAVAAGNTETSQRLVDTLLLALGLQACSQGTMNNFVFGNQHCSYYETICGGTGAGNTHAGADAVHSHMTNTAITDIEIFERRYPVRVRTFAIRPESGGSGKFPGGNGVIREVEFLDDCDVSLLTQHRKERPYGLHGGQDGAPGKQTLIQESGQHQVLAHNAALRVSAGDRIRIETPGGGGWGDPIPH